MTNVTQDVVSGLRDRPTDEIEITPEMKVAGGAILIEEFDPGPYWAECLAASIFKAMMAVRGPSAAVQLSPEVPERDREIA
jgi:hypothetical protein